MDRYLEQHFKGTYRIKAHYDQNTNDWCREPNGEFDDSFGDFYLDCKNNIEIKHGVGKELYVYCPNKARGVNILKQIYMDKVKNTLPKETKETSKYFEKLCQELIDADILFDIDVLDYEVMFGFKTSLIDYIAKLVGAKTSGANIGALSVKNLPKNHYEIPKNDLDQYEKLIKLLPIRTMERQGKNGETIKATMPDTVIINGIMRSFESIIKKAKGKNYDLNTEQRKRGLRGREFIHSIGMWNEFIKFVTNEVKKYG